MRVLQTQRMTQTQRLVRTINRGLGKPRTGIQTSAGLCVSSDAVAVVFDDIHCEEDWSHECANVGEEVGD